ncbi:MAG TPA: tetratricopeptide repeat protein [Steroidobacteraceae bacterium]|nr:tetratricopeptide repeat protein [Steroidobacteraceae bacterium]
MRRVPRGVAVVATLFLCCTGLSACGGTQARFAKHMARGEKYLSQGNLEKAQVEFRDALQIAPDHADARVLTGRVAERLGDVRDALSLYQSAVEIDPHFTPARVSLGKLYVFAGLPKKAIAAVEPALVSHPNDADLLTVRGAARAELHQAPAALADAEHAVRVAPQNEDAIALLASLYAEAGASERAVDLVRSAIAVHPSSVQLRQILADLYARAGKVELAADELARVIALRPSDLSYRYALAALYARAKREDDAERVLKEAIAAAPRNDEPKLAYVELIAQERSPALAASALADLVRRNPDDYDLQIAEATLLQRQDKLDEAAAGLRSVISRAGDRPQGLVARTRLAAQLMSQRRFAAAAPLIAEVLVKAPQDDAALLLHGTLAIERDEPSAAIGDLRAVLRDEPNAVSVMRALARAYRAAGQMTLAEETLRNAIDTAPKDSGARVELAGLLAQSHRLDEGIGTLQQAARDLPNDLSVRAALVRLELQKPDLDAAAAAARQLSALAPARAVGAYLEGLVAQMRGDRGTADGYFREALRRQLDDIDTLAAISGLEFASGQSAIALGRIESLVEREPANAALCNLAGELELRLKVYQRASDELMRCIQLAPYWSLPYRNLGAALSASGNLDGAAAIYRRGLAEAGPDAVLVSELATLDEREGRGEDAILQYEMLYEQDPHSVLAENNLAMLLVTYKSDRADLDRALQLTSGFIDSDNAALLDTAGWVRLKSGDAAQALLLLAKAVAAAPRSSVLRYHLGIAQLQAGERDLARSNLQSALAGDKEFPGRAEARAALARLQPQSS